MPGDLRRGAAALALLTLSLGIAPTAPASAAGEHDIVFRAFTPGVDPDDYPTSRLYSAGADGVLTQVDAKSTSNGGYLKFSVPDGTYKLRTSGDTYAGSEPEWYQDHPSAAGAEEIVVAGADVRLDDVFVQPYRTLSGRVVSPHGEGLLGVSVYAYPSGDADDYGASAITDPTGHFTLRTGLGRWKVLVSDRAHRVARVWAGGATTHGAAQIIDVTHDVTIPTITTNVGASVSGTVTSTLGSPVRALWVTAYDARGDVVGSAITGHDGRYRVRALAAGPKRLRIGVSAGPSFPFRPEFYDNVAEIPGLPGATVIPVAEDEDVTGRDAVVTALTQETPSSPGVSGRVVDSHGTPVAGLRVWAATQDDPGSAGGSNLAVAHTDAAGGFSLSDMPVGAEFRIFFDARPTEDPDGQLGLTPIWYPSSPTFAGAQVFVAPPARVTVADAVLPDIGGIRGMVLLEDGSPLIEPGGDPSDDPLVQAFDLAGAVVESTTVGNDGSYRFDELPAGAYRVRFAAGDYLSDYQEQWWGGESQATATPVQVDGGTYVDGVDGLVRTKLRPIVGKVVDESGVPVPGIAVTAYGADDEGDESTGGTQTEKDGTFDVLVPPGVYRLQVVRPDYTARYQSEFFQDSATRAGAAPVTVVDDQPPVSLGTITIAKRPAMSGRMTDQRGSPIARGVVMGQHPNGGFAFDVKTDANGYWESPGLEPGSYLLSFHDYNGEHASEYYSDVASSSSASPVSLDPATHVTGLDAMLTYGDKHSPDPRPHSEPANTARPRIIGAATYPEVLTADPGSWSAGDPPSFTYRWTSSGRTVGTGPFYSVKAADIGQDLVLVVSATAGGQTVSAESAPVRVIRAASRTRITDRPPVAAGHEMKRLRIIVNVTGPGEAHGGLVELRVDGRVVATIELNQGHVRRSILLASGRHTIKARFLGSTAWSPSRDRTTIRIR